MNAILREDRAIVTEIPGTTRDVLNEPVAVNGLPLLLSDTAGIRETTDPIEKRGVEKSMEQAESAELVLFVADRSEPPHPLDIFILQKITHKTYIMVLNKKDLPAAPGWEGYTGAVGISATAPSGLDDLYARIHGLFMDGLPTYGQEADIITRERHRYLLRQSANHLTAAVNAIKNNIPEDLVSVDIKAAYLSLNELVGAEIGDDVAERIFSEFCVGK
jgi:tRNA modification GTPase